MNELRIGAAVEVSGVTIIPIEKINSFAEIHTKTIWWYGSKDLYAVVISTPSGLRVLDKDAREMDMNDLIRIVPQLTDTLDTRLPAS